MVEDNPAPESRAYRLIERSLDDMMKAPPLCDACKEPQIFGCAVGLRIQFFSAEICSECASKLCADFVKIRDWRPAATQRS